MYFILRILSLQQKLSIILSSIWTIFYSFLFNNNERFQLFLADVYIIVADLILNAKNDPNMNDQYLGELNFIKIS